jgi:hypothetical protein
MGVEMDLQRLTREKEIELRDLVERVGGVWTGIQYYGKEPIVFFRASKEAGFSTRSLYLSAVNTDNIVIALKQDREELQRRKVPVLA